MALEVFAFSRALTYIGRFTSAKNISFTEELSIRGEGVAQFRIHFSAEELKKPSMATALNYQNILVIHDTESDYWFPWFLEKRETGVDEEGLYRDISGRGGLALLSHAVVLSEKWSTDFYPIGDTRWFSWASRDGIWYDPAEWLAPEAVLWTAETTERKRQPQGWPDKTAYWIWVDDPETDSPPGETYYRKNFTLADVTNLSIFATGDNEYKLYLDGEELGRGANFRNMGRYDIKIDSGDHVLAAGVTNFAGPDTPAGFILAMYESDESTLDLTSLILHTDTSWVCREWLDGPPGWDPGDILKTLIAEAKGRGINTGFARIKCDWSNTADTDSDGNTWSAYQRRARSWELGTNLLQVEQNLSEGSAEFQMTWDPTDPEGDPNNTLVLKIRKQQGVDRTTGDSPMVFRRARDVTEPSWAGDDSNTATRLIIKTGGGWYQQDASGATIIREAYVSMGQTDNPANAVDLSVQAFALTATASESFTAVFVSKEGKIPFLDFGVGDWVYVEDSAGELVPTRISALTLGQAQETGATVYVPEFDTLPLDPKARQTRWLRAMLPGALNGMLGSAREAKLPAPKGSTMRPYTVPFSLIGALAVSASPVHDVQANSLISELTARVKTASTSGDISIGFYRNGTLIDTVTIVEGATFGHTFVSEGAHQDDELSVGVIDPGDGAADLTCQIRMSAVS